MEPDVLGETHKDTALRAEHSIQGRRKGKEMHHEKNSNTA